jgi:PhnB protein
MTPTIHLIVSDADAASRWYQRAFSGLETSRVQLPDGRLIHVGVQIGSRELPCAFYLHTDDVDALWDKAIAAGATVVRPVADVLWGEREGQLKDPFGYRWGLTQQIREVSKYELAEHAALMFSATA